MPDFGDFLRQLRAEPTLLAAVLPAVGIMIVNGWTDAPVAIAAAVKTKALRLRPAVLLASLCNFAGAVTMMLTGSAVAVSIYSISGFGAEGSAVPALAAACAAVILWSLVALYYGIPTSESHALLSGLTGAAVAAGGWSASMTGEWIKVLFGLAVSTVPMMYASRLVTRGIVNRFGGRGNSKRLFGRLQIAGAALSSFAHGAQDGQKFAGVFTVAALSAGTAGEVTVPLWTAGLSAVVISLGTLLGGRRIIDSFDEFASSDPAAGFSADLTSSVLLFILSFLGIPASTTHAKTCAVIGSGSRRGRSRAVHGDTAGSDAGRSGTVFGMCAAWALTFPVCAVFGFIFSDIFSLIMG